MKVGELFAGISGFGLGFERAGGEVLWQVEQEPFCLAVLKTHFPDAERFTDVRDVGRRNLKRVDVIVAGVPCQDVSVAGKRAGLAGERTGLFYEFARILQELRPPWFVFENVPGLFSSNNGRDFAEVLRVLMVECGYGVQWRVLNSQFFGVAQRRRRVFIVGSLGRPCPSEVLFEPESGRRHFEACEEAGTRIAAPLTSGSGVTGNAPGRRREDDINLVRAFNAADYKNGTFEEASISRPITGTADRSRGGSIVSTLLSGENRTGGTRPPGSTVDNADSLVVAATLRASDGHHGRSSPRGDGQDNLVAALTPVRGGPDDNDAQAGHIVIQDVRGGTRDRTDSGQGIGITEGGPCYTLSKTEQHAVAYNIIGGGQHSKKHAYATDRTGTIQHKGNSASGNEAGTIIGTLRADAGAPKHASDERQLHVSEAPDSNGVRSFTGLPEGLDSARYRALGNAVTVQISEWIARRISAQQGVTV